MADPTRTASPDAVAATASVADADSTTAPPAETVLAQPASGSAARYAIGDEIARGGMGEVYRATDTVLGREVAVKVLQARFGPNSGAARRFADEARITGQLQHPAIPPVHDLGTLPDGRPFLAMKLIRGDTLDTELKRRSDPTQERGRFVAVFEAICQAVAYAHAHGVIHRDLKPANVMVGNFGEVQVMDWGLAKVLRPRSASDGPADAEETAAGTQVVSLRDSDGSFTQAGSVLGTPAYMPPEQAVGAVGKIDQRSDVFGLGAILAVILTGKPPFGGGSVETTRVQAAQGDVAECFARLDQCGAEPELVALCRRCLSPKPADRPVDAGQVATTVAELRAAAAERARRAELDRAAAELTTAAQRKRRKLLLAAGGILCGVLFAGIVGTTIGLLQAREAKEAERKRADGEQAAKEKEEEALRIATSQIDLTSDALGDLVLKVQLELEEAPGGRHIRKEILEDTMKKLSRLYDSPATSDRLYRRYASAHSQLGQIHWDLNRRDLAEVEYKKAGEYVEKAYQANPTSDKTKSNLASHYVRMGDSEVFYHKRLEPGRKLYLDGYALARQVADKLAALPDGDPALPEPERIPFALASESVVEIEDRLGILALRWDFDYPTAEKHYKKSLAIRKRNVEKAPTIGNRSLVGQCYNYLAELALQRGDLPGGTEFHRQLLAVREVIFKERSWSIKVRRELAEAQNHLGDDLMMAKKDEEGNRQYLDSLQLFRQILASEPDDPIFQSQVATACYCAGTSSTRLGDKVAARKLFEEGLTIRLAVYEGTKDELQRLNMQPQVMFALARCGKHAQAAEMAANVRKQLGTLPIHLVEAAGTYGLCMAAVGEGKPLAGLTPDERKFRKQYLDLAIACLEEARQKKYDDALNIDSDGPVNDFVSGASGAAVAVSSSRWPGSVLRTRWRSGSTPPSIPRSASSTSSTPRGSPGTPASAHSRRSGTASGSG